MEAKPGDNTVTSPREQLLSRVAAGERICDVAKDLGIEPNTGRQWVRRHKIESQRSVEIEAHHNSKVSERSMNDVLAADLTGQSHALVSSAANHHRVYKRVFLPDDYPHNQAEWREDVIKFAEIAIWKGFRRLADTGVEEIDLRNLAVTTAIMTEKHALLSGGPTSVSAQFHVSVRPESILANLRAGQTQERVIEVSSSESVLPSVQSATESPSEPSI